MATMVETITGLQLVVNQSHMETQLKLDQITTHLQIPQESLFDDSDAEHDSGSHKRKFRRPFEADKNKIMLSALRTYATPVPPTSVGKNQCPTKILMSRPSPSPSPVQYLSNVLSKYPILYIYIFLDIVQDITNSLSKSRPVPSKSRPSPSPSPIPTLVTPITKGY